MSGVLVAGPTFGESTANPDLNLISVTGGASNVTYLVGPSVFPPVALSNYFNKVSNTYPVSQYTIGLNTSSGVFEIYNGSNVSANGTVSLPNGSTEIYGNSNCWFVNNYTANGGGLSVTRIGTNGTALTKDFAVTLNTFPSFANKFTPTSFILQFLDSSSQWNLIVYTTQTNEFTLKNLSFSSVADLRSTYIPSIV